MSQVHQGFLQVFFVFLHSQGILNKLRKNEQEWRFDRRSRLSRAKRRMKKSAVRSKTGENVRKPTSPDSLFHSNSLSSQPMSEKQSVELNQDALDVVDAWLGTSTATTENTQPVFEKRAQRLGLGAKFVPHKKVSV